MYGTELSRKETKNFLDAYKMQPKPSDVYEYFKLDNDKALKALKDNPGISLEYDTSVAVKELKDSLDNLKGTNFVILSLMRYDTLGVVVFYAASRKDKMFTPVMLGAGTSDLLTYTNDDYDKQHDVILNLVTSYRDISVPVAGFDASQKDITVLFGGGK